LLISKRQRMSSKKEKKKLTLKQAERGIYIDFEGFQDAAPSLIGILVDEHFEQVVLAEELILAGEAKNMRPSTFEEVVGELILLCKNENRKIIAFSQYEANTISEYANIDIRPFYKDARKIAKRWYNTFYYESKPRPRALKEFLEFIEYPRGKYLGNQKSTSRIKNVQEMLQKKGSYHEITSVAKAKWTKLLKHNQIDCEGMKALMIRAAKELSD